MMRTTLLSAYLLASLSWLVSPIVLCGQEVAPAKAVAAAEVTIAEDVTEDAANAEAELKEEEQEVKKEEAKEQGTVDFAVVQAALNDPQIRLLRTYAQVNAALARRVCQLSQAEEEQLAKMDDTWLVLQFREAVDSPIKNAAAGIARFLQGRAVQRAQPRPDHQQITLERVKQVIDAHIEQALTDSHRGKFRSERDERQKFRTDSLARVLVAALDTRLFLSDEQRQQLETEVAKWINKDLHWRFYFQNQSFIPDIPKTILARVLTTEQLASLQGAQAWLYELAQAELHMMQEEPLLIER